MCSCYLRAFFSENKRKRQVASPTTFIENLSILPECKRLWRNYCKDHRTSAVKLRKRAQEAKQNKEQGVLGYQATYWQEIAKHFGDRFPS